MDNRNTLMAIAVILMFCLPALLCGNDDAVSSNEVVDSEKTGSQADTKESPPTPAPQQEQTNLLLAWWKLDEADSNDVADSSGNGFDGRLLGDPQWRPAGGKVGGALEFDGDGDRVEIGNESAFDLAGPVTIAAWVKVGSFDKRWQTIISKGDTSWRLQRTASENSLAFHCTGIESVEGQWSNGIEGKKNVNDGQWHHVAGVYDGSKIALYIDGELDSSSEASGSIQTNTSIVLVGANSEVSDREWNGLIDEVCVFVCALDANNVSALYSGGNPITVAEEAPTPDESIVNRVLSLDGQDDYVLITDSQSLHSFSDAITIEVWVKASSYAEDGGINSIIRKNIAEGDENFLLRFRNIGGNLWAQMSLGGIGILGTQHEFSVGKWYHLAGTYDGSAITILVNGVTVESGKFSGPLHINQSDLFIGKGDPEFSSGEYYRGALDEIRIWNIVRSQEEIQGVMNVSLTGKEEGLVAYWNFDDGTAKDLSGHDNDGLLADGAQIVQSPRPDALAPGDIESNKLIAWWKFENDANDSAGANHGTVHGNPEYADGKFGRAISLDVNDYVDCGNPDSLNFGSGDWTISAWIKTTQSGTNEDDAHMNRGTIFANGGDEEGGVRYSLGVNEAGLDRVTLTTDDDRAKVQATTRAVVNDGAWHHIVGTRAEGQLRVYVDGVLDGSNYLPAGYDLSGTSQHNAYIGAITDHRDSSIYKCFVGLIDEVCIIRGFLDANGVALLYSGENPVKVAKTALIIRPQQKAPDGVQGSIEGDWKVTSDQNGREYVIEIRSKADGALDALIVVEGGNGTSQKLPLTDVTFKNGTLNFIMPSNQGVFEGRMKKDGLTIEGQFRQQEQSIAVMLKRIDISSSRTVPNSQAQLQTSTGGKSNIVIVLVLVLALASIIAGIVMFLVKSSIR